MMNDYIIITDSATDMPKEIVEKYNLHVIPTPVVIEGKDYFDGENPIILDSDSSLFSWIYENGEKTGELPKGLTSGGCKKAARILSLG